jgi:peptidoglycan/LPS O-acetylase OafA/YrhL
LEFILVDLAQAIDPVEMEQGMISKDGNGRVQGTFEGHENSSFVSFLDLARWLAAAIVFFGHLRDPLFLGYGSLPVGARGPLVSIWYFITGWHGEAVTVFFVLSGYLVGAMGLAKASAGRFRPREYAIDRVTRIFLPFVPALVLTACLDLAGGRLFSGTGFYTHEHPMIREKIAIDAFQSFLTPQIFLSNLAMLQTIWSPSFGSDQPLWTISLEFWFYVVFGVALTASLATRRMASIAGLLAAGALLAVLGANFIVFLGLWAIGAAVGLIRSSTIERPVVALLVFLGVLVSVRLNVNSFRMEETLRMFRDYLVAASFAWVLISMRRVRLGFLTRGSGFNRFLADFSYSLYLIHFPLMLFVLGALHATGRFDGIARGYSATDPQGLLAYVLTIAVVGACAWAFSQATERQTWRLRRILRARFDTQLKSRALPDLPRQASPHSVVLSTDQD